MKPLGIIIGGVFPFAILAMRITRYFSLEKWHVSIGLAAIALLLYLINNVLIQYFIRKRMPDFASTEEVIPGIQKWELTAGLGIVPRWVSGIGLLAISALITAILPWIIALIRIIF